jgi:hypothetical protein
MHRTHPTGISAIGSAKSDRFWKSAHYQSRHHRYGKKMKRETAPLQVNFANLRAFHLSHDCIPKTYLVMPGTFIN